MNLTDFQFNTRSLSQDILRTCWWVVVLYAIATSSNLFFTSHNRINFFYQVILLPSLEMGILVLLLKWYVSRTAAYIEYVMIFGVNLLISIIIFSLYELPIVFYLLVIPILISLFYYRQRVILFALLQGLVTMILINVISPQIRGGMTVGDLIMLISLLIATTMIINNLRKRFYAMAQELIRTIQEKQDLQTKNILMEKLNRIDAATGLYNHRSFHEHLDNVMSLQGSSELSIHLAILDIDNFKQVNDTFGHAAGDAVIKFVADQLKKQLEPDDFASRYGGEEFAILSVDQSTDRFYAQLEQIRTAIMEQEQESLEGKKVTISISVQRLLPDMSKSELFQGADMALYSAKRTGKNRTILAGQAG
jgi:diguanylate cyclase